MGVDENIFIKVSQETEPLLDNNKGKGTESKAKKKKKQLSEGQLKGLAKGRAKMAEKKKIEKHEKKMAKREENKALFNGLKATWQKKAKGLNEMREYRKLLSDITEEDYDDIEQLGNKLLQKAKSYKIKSNNNINETDSKRSSEEQEVEQ